MVRQRLACYTLVALALTMAPTEDRNVRKKLFSIILTVVFMIKIFTSSQVYRLPKSTL